MPRSCREDAEMRERLLLLRYRRKIAAQELELNRLEIRRKRLEISILALVAVLLIASAIPGHLVLLEATVPGNAAIDLGALVQLRA
jgi:hypothetical protein